MAKRVYVGEATCRSEDRAFFIRSRLFIDFREAIDSLNEPLKFGNKRQIQALQAYQSIMLWRENF